MHRILIAGSVHPAGLALLDASQNVTYDYEPSQDPTAYHAHLATADAVVIRTQPLTASDINAAPMLKVVSRHGVGYDAVDVAALTARSIPLTITGNVNSHTVAEHAMLLLLATARRLLPTDKGLRCGDWAQRNDFAAHEVKDKTLLIIGYGRIGRNLARMAQGFSMRVIAYDPFLHQNACADIDLVFDLHAALQRADFVSLHVPKVDTTLIGAQQLDLMKPNAILINTARGGIVDEAALINALHARKIAGAGLDVFVQEPPPNDCALWSLDNVVVTPHSAALTQECAERMAVVSIQNVLNFFQKTLDRSLVVNADAIGY